MSNVFQRVITGILLVAIITTLIVWNIYSYFFLMAAINILTIQEFYGLLKNYTRFPRKAAGMLFSFCLFSGIILTVTFTAEASILLVLIPLTSIFFLIEIFQKSSHPIQNIAILFLGTIWITLPVLFFTLSAMVAPVENTYDPAIPLTCFILLWVFDSFAYFTGSLFGKSHIFPRLSPNKTLEGWIGGAICCVIVACILPYFSNSLSRTDWVIIAFIIAITGTLGDVSKSVLKRNLGIKDSGRLLPGHGGMLDRFDSFLGSAPFIYAYLIIFK